MDGALANRLARHWWAIGLRGLFAIAFGILALFFTGPAIAGLLLFFAAYMLADGILGIIAGVRAARQHARSWPLFLEGAADIAVGVIAVAMPDITLVALVWVMGIWAVVTGVLVIAAAIRLRRDIRGEWLFGLAGAVSVIWGAMLLLWPLVGAVVMTWWLGAYALVFGVLLVVLAFRLRGRRDQTATSVPQRA